MDSKEVHVSFQCKEALHSKDSHLALRALRYMQKLS